MDNDVNYTVVGIICIAIVSIIVGSFVVKNPPETIEIDGYTYTLYEAPPEEYIEVNGHTYRLESEDSAENS